MQPPHLCNAPHVPAKDRLLLGFPFVINNGLCPSVPISVGNATLFVSEHVYV
jgi:hypothetical protein